jgi:hypothetical protein
VEEKNKKGQERVKGRRGKTRMSLLGCACSGSNLEAVEGTLLLFLVKSQHTLFELSTGGFGFTTSTTLFFDGLERKTGRAALFS